MKGHRNLFSRAVLGFVVAATGVGAGDLLTASLASSAVGLIILWAAWAGALLKFVLNEGIARWQMATGQTILEGWWLNLPSLFPWLFFIYFLLWSFYVGGALINACGVAGVGFLSFGHPDLGLPSFIGRINPCLARRLQSFPACYDLSDGRHGCSYISECYPDQARLGASFEGDFLASLPAPWFQLASRLNGWSWRNCDRNLL